MKAKQFALRLTEARKKNGMTQVALSKKAGITQDWISHFECGRRLPSLKVFSKLVDALGISADSLL